MNQFSLNITNSNEVIDNLTGLVWKRCPEGKSHGINQPNLLDRMTNSLFNLNNNCGSICNGDHILFTYDEAMRYASTQQGGWRIPTRNEFFLLSQSILLISKSELIDIFPSSNLGELLWSCSENPEDSSFARVIYFDGLYGDWSVKKNSFNLLLVRDDCSSK